ncbi:MAG: histidine kinase [Bacteroidota bacterium]
MFSDIYIKSDFRLFRFTWWNLVIPVIIGLIITLLAYPQGFLSVNVMVFVFFYSLAIGIPSMKSFEYIEWKLEQHLPWLKRPGMRLILTALLEIIIGILILTIVNYLIFIVIQRQQIEMLYSKTFEGMKYLAGTVLISIILINLSYFFKSWKQSAVNEEKLKREKLSIEYEALKNLVTPHFVFNSLTALSSLVHKDQEKAVKFIQEFSNVFRYVLESREKEVIDLATEKSLLESVSYMYRIRYQDSLNINIDLPEAADKYIIPMALQMLLENAIKHNTTSAGSPLVIEIREEKDYIVVKNNLQLKKTEIASNKIGLENIKSRYKYLSDKEVLVDASDKSFMVRIPVLSVKNDKGINY